VCGRLRAVDMRRLEQACAPALIEDSPPLDIDLEQVTELDVTAVAMLTRLRRRGARIHGATWVEDERIQ
jgi:ABC-type transporter Mla MlaB component